MEDEKKDKMSAYEIYKYAEKHKLSEDEYKILLLKHGVIKKIKS